MSNKANDSPSKKATIMSKKLYLEKITYNRPKIGAILYVVEWYIVYAIVYLMSGSWKLFGNETFKIKDLIPFMLVLIVGLGLLSIRDSYIKASNELKSLLRENAHKEMLDKMIRPKLSICIYIVFSIFALYRTFQAIFIESFAYYQQDLGGQIYIIHNLLWYLIIGLPILAEFVSIVIGVVIFPNLVEENVKCEKINPIEPYRCGGMRPIGELFLTTVTTYFFILILYNEVFLCEGETSMRILVYIMWVLGVFIFTIHQLKIHRILKNYKKQSLTTLKSEIETQRELIYKLKDSKYENINQNDSIEKHAIVLSTLMSLFIEIEKMRDYPFDLGIIRNFLILILLPILIEILKMYFGGQSVEVGEMPSNHNLTINLSPIS